MSHPRDNDPDWYPSTFLLRHLPHPGSTKARLGAVGIMALVAALSLMPNLSVPGAAPAYTDLVIHLGMQGSLGGALVWGWPRALPLVAVALGILVVGLEIGQIWVPGRDFDMVDLGMNTVGAGLGAVLATWLARRRRPREQTQSM